MCIRRKFVRQTQFFAAGDGLVDDRIREILHEHREPIMMVQGCHDAPNVHGSAAVIGKRNGCFDHLAKRHCVFGRSVLSGKTGHKFVAYTHVVRCRREIGKWMPTRGIVPRGIGFLVKRIRVIVFLVLGFFSYGSGRSFLCSYLSRQFILFRVIRVSCSCAQSVR